MGKNYAQEDGFHSEIMGSVSTTKDESKECIIKGNIGKDKIYHTPDSPWYNQPKAEVMFCTEAEDKEAGFRAPK
ncbi:hypothetical protein [Sporosarcina sp. Te-1]|uniref:sunset domain-containing protein n=1 Tax=Sporosarcina sp. Te-1 TaxID=2818390 RepID=UPI001A9FB66C|nr:hypothetical protein [Sporosarcina sp. Te-1]QTD42623.1 hypothetical protein J3U78_07425 [Sporosarcina sp. Te-1]